MFTISQRRSLVAAVCVAGAFACVKNDSQEGVRANQDTTQAHSIAPTATPVADGTPPDGRAVFGRTCQTCHGQDARGLTNMYPPLAGSPYVNGDKDRMIRLVLHGLQGPITVEGKNFNNVMPPWRSLSDAELAAVISFVRTNFGNHGGAVTIADVAHARQATANRTTMWTAQELR